MNLGGYNYTNFQNVRVKGNNSGGPGTVRFQAASDFEQTLVANADYTDADKTITLPAKTGTVGVTGTFTVNLPGVAATTFAYSTVVTVTGIRSEDGLVCTLQDAADSTARILSGATAGAGAITLYFLNVGAAVNADDFVVAYTAVR